MITQLALENQMKIKEYEEIKNNEIKQKEKDLQNHTYFDEKFEDNQMFKEKEIILI